MTRSWAPLANNEAETRPRPRALVVLNQPFSIGLLDRLWSSAQWRCCADGGANRLHDLLLRSAPAARRRYIPDLVKGDFDSLRDDVKAYYTSQGASVVHDEDQYSTDLMKCVHALEEKEKSEGVQVPVVQYELILLGGLSGRLDQTVHTLHYLHKMRKSRDTVYAFTDDNVGWVLDEGDHEIHVDQTLFGPTCGLLPVGIETTTLTTRGLRWDIENWESSFDTRISTSNQFVPGQDVVRVSTTRPIWWCMEIRASGL
ncbi:Thiamin pyrophosphokinase [Punctularia strigosozonata HHB-11173 SS5]|uniref:Thiamine pyrophosphokinase n=1 Tax=Punctularia strigosozonata (strain HHB-11173) TaxID=741275 RepID=R7S1L9_PUNST|nr:thiamine pyrophosphokinase [Punctularia strigosozonata HHB-11173 SS5]EIN03724.1 Thiamin pyrophosphokinase [Punctularia strigosozonata HHB-11173 SS5]